MRQIETRSAAASGADPDGVRIVAGGASGRRQRMVFQALAVFFAAACAAYVLMPRQLPHASEADLTRAPETKTAIDAEAREHPVVGSSAPTVEKEDATASATVKSATAATASNTSARPLTPRRLASHRTEPKAPERGPDEVPADLPRDVTMAQYIQALHDAGIHEGIGAFNPPGTSPPLEGLEVPDDYELPDGYVRHYQSTDDGQPIRPILMYSPDYEFTDENGNVMQIPEDRVVRPENAPPGLPIQPVKIPPPAHRDPGDTGRMR